MTPDEILKAVRVFWREQPPGINYIAWFDKPKREGGSFRQIAIPHDTPIAEALANAGEMYDLYFAVNSFQGDRVSAEANGGSWLYADLDEVDPRELLDDAVQPTVAWESSPGRYQCAWRLDQVLEAERLEQLNRAMTYHTGADKGGWSLTKVLRVPGSKNYKRDEVTTGKLLWSHGPVYTERELQGLLVEELKTKVARGTGLIEPSPLGHTGVWKKWGARIPAPTRKVIRSRVAEGDRSKVLFKLECSLIETGLSPEEVMSLVRITVWNKWKGMRSEQAQLSRDIQRAVAYVGDRAGTGLSKDEAAREAKRQRARERRKRAGSRLGPSGSVAGRSPRVRRSGPPKTAQMDEETTQALKALGMYSAHDFVTRGFPAPSWLVKSIWAEGASGLLAGEMKSYKSTIALDMAVSVASGTPFLGQMEVDHQGPVVMVLGEGTPGNIQQWMQGMAAAKGIWKQWDEKYFQQSGVIALPGLTEDMAPMYLSIKSGFQLTDEEDMENLEKVIAGVKPKLVVLDPFYALAPTVNENEASDVSPVLQAMNELKMRHDTGLLLVHHFKKPQAGAAGGRLEHRVSGSSNFMRWYESAVFAEVNEEETNTTTLIAKHREFEIQKPLKVHIHLDTGEDREGEDRLLAPEYQVSVEEVSVGDDVDPGQLLFWSSVLEEELAGHVWVYSETLKKKLKGITAKIMDLMLKERGWTIVELPRGRAGTRGGGGKRIAVRVEFAAPVKEAVTQEEALELLGAEERVAQANEKARKGARGSGSGGVSEG